MKEFFKTNLQDIITPSRGITPDPKFTILKLGLRNYYATFKSFNHKKGFSYFEGNKSEVLSFAIEHEYITTSYNSILLIHLFFEQYINEILYNINPILIYGKLNKEIDLVNALTNKWDKIALGKKSIEYNNKLSRICELISNDDASLNAFRVPMCYHFILEHKNALEELSHQRNEIIHSGDKILAKYAYELLMSNYVLPIVKEVLLVQEKPYWIKRKTHCDIDVIEELSNIKLPENHLTQLEAVQLSLKKINHYKELGRASLENPLGMFEHGGDHEHKRKIEQIHNGPLRQIANSEAMLRATFISSHKIHTCPCCGTNSLLTFDFWKYFEDNSLWVEKAKCFLCTYSISRDIGEPSEFGIKCEKLFEKIQ